MYEDPGGMDEATARPYFFLSYAHTPRATGRGAGDPDHWVRKLYDDLCEAVLVLTDLPAGAQVGFMDQSMHQGERWAERLSKELAGCRVFVPLYSPRYFNSLACGQEWHSFTRRPVFPARAGSDLTTAIVPVLWVATGQYALPKVASDLQFNHSSFGADYAAEGLYALMKLSYFQASYELAVHRLAKRIVEVADETVIPVGRRLNFQAQPSAFEAKAPVRRLQISVFASHHAELPQGRSTDWYGPDRLDWHPYRPHGGRPLADHAVRLAKQLGFHPSVQEFDAEAAGRLAGADPGAPGLLLLDRWALGDEERRELVRQFDRANPPWVSVLEPWNADDQECVEHTGHYSELSDRVLRNKHRDAKPSFAEGDTTGLASLEDFEEALPRAAMRAKYAFEDHTRTTQPTQTGSPKPNLRAAFDEPRAPAPGPGPSGSGSPGGTGGLRGFFERRAGDLRAGEDPGAAPGGGVA
ncbi:hypothetical protein CFP65_4438 [Kitasatospora sp. MMS16-BH015]|uniref:TIR-like protein FxsC n=1 Tax=Kitasatospora sp. MMS16-BH015 TaxID=2018025 RepID=UPI000CA25E34|nr:TIR-like protein FxsC [Kitasatospora sp. MMS16-BH015]AUG79185.1 hypothetical protein CFP65_4438 [Kitasatospora sp. MMS16-BH015]